MNLDIRGPCGQDDSRHRGDWVGVMVAANFFALGKGFAGVIVRVGLTTEEQFDQTPEGVRTDLTSRHVQCYTPFFVIIGQR